MDAGFNNSLKVSATPGLTETLPAFLDRNENCFMDESFEARVIDTLMQKQNRGFIHLGKEVSSPKEFFAQIPHEAMQTITTIIDRGSILTDFKAEEIIKAYLNIDQSKRATQTAAFFATKKQKERQKMHLQTQSTDDDTISTIEIDGAALIAELKKQGLKPEDFLLFLFLDLSKTTGTDIARPYQDKAGLTVGKQQTVTETIQAAMRERKLLEPNAQSVTWIMFQTLYQQIHPDNNNEFDLRKIFKWLIKNEAESIETKLIARAYQGIHQAISEYALNQISLNPESYAQYAALFESQQSISPFDLYEIESNKEQTSEVLSGYCNSLLHEFNIPKSYLLTSGGQRVQKIIKETSELIEFLDDPPKTQVGVEVEQAVEQEAQEQTKGQTQEQQRVKTRLDSVSHYHLVAEQYDVQKDSITTLFDNPSYQQLALPHCDNIKLPDLRFLPAHFAVTNLGIQEPGKLTELKPINQLLIRILPNSSIQYVACTAAGLEFYSNQIQQQSFTEGSPAFAIVSLDGTILSRSNNITMEKLTNMISGQSCQRMFAYSHLLNGKISQPEVIAKLIRENNISYEDFIRIVDAIQNVHMSHHPISLLDHQALYALCGWHGKAAPELITRQPVNSPKKASDALVKLTTSTQLSNQVPSMDKPPYYPHSALDKEVLGKKAVPYDEQIPKVSLNTQHIGLRS